MSSVHPSTRSSDHPTIATPDSQLERCRQRHLNAAAALDTVSHQAVLEENIGSVFGAGGNKYLAVMRLDHVHLLPHNTDPTQVCVRVVG